MSKLPPVDRRNFVRLMLAGGAGSMAGCVREQTQKIVSPIDRPEEMIPGKVLDYATVCRACPAGCGLTVRTREARASKLEGIAEHPVNDGALCARGHAELQRLYSPQRLHEPLARNDAGDLVPIGWDEALSRLADAVGGAASEETGPQDQGSTAVLSRGLGPTMRMLLGNFTEALGGSLLEYEPYPFAAMRAASQLAFGQPALWRPRIENARVILSLGADFLETWLSPVAQARGYAEARRYQDGGIGLHYQVEPRLSLTGANADEWFDIRPGTEHVFALGLLRVILQENLAAPLEAATRQALVQLAAPYDSARVEEITDVPAAQIVHLARTFALTRPALALPPGLSSSGEATTAAHLATLLLNLAVGGLGDTLELVRSALLEALSSPAELQQLQQRMRSGAISVLVLHDTNPLLTLPDIAGWTEALAGVPLVVALGSTLDETAAHADLVLPISTPIESWDDWEPYAGVLGLQQPATRPLAGTRQAGDLFVQLAAQIGGAVAGSIPWSGFTDLLRDRWSEVHGAAAPNQPFEQFWRQTLQRGGVWNDAETVTTTPTDGLLSGAWLPPPPSPPPASDNGFHLMLVPSLHHYDGGREPTGWLQEVPDPMSQVAWGAWAEVHPDTARREGIQQGDLVAVETTSGKLLAPAVINRWVRADTVAVPLGMRYDTRGTDGARLSAAHLLDGGTETASGELLWSGALAQLRRIGPRNQLLSPRASIDEAGRPLAQTVALDALRRGDGAAEAEQDAKHSLYSEHEHPDHRWGMVIDTHACIGCNACTTACYAENNIPVVGRQQMELGREMTWLRIEVYDDGLEQPEMRFLPMLCQQCDNAPCEPVCPVFATYHNPEGLNAQVYNRCVGTRYCSNNCPYKVRRFNWLQPEFEEPLNRQLNPNVTVRDAGVMEKCTFCVQRIQAAKFRASDEKRELADGDVIPACGQTCPTGAITFGDFNDPDSAVTRAAHDTRAYTVLEHLNTKPAVRYLKRITVGRSA